MTRAQAVAALLDRWADEVGEDAGHGLLLGLLLARADPTLADAIEQGVQEMAEGDMALANQAARDQWCAALRDWFREQKVAV